VTFIGALITLRKTAEASAVRFVGCAGRISAGNRENG